MDRYDKSQPVANDQMLQRYWDATIKQSLSMNFFGGSAEADNFFSGNF